MNNVNSVSRKTVKEMIREKEQQMPDSGQVGSIGGEMVKRMIRKQEANARQAAMDNLEGGE